MERLTEPIENYDNYKTARLVGCKDDQSCEDFYNGHCVNCIINIRAVEKLANYEDAEEKGWLVLFPVAIGDHIWQISPKNSIKELEIIEMSVEKDGVKYAVGRPLDNSADVIFALANVEIKNNFFYTKKEAEKRLKELENEHEKIN